MKLISIEIGIDSVSLGGMPRQRVPYVHKRKYNKDGTSSGIKKYFPVKVKKRWTK